MNVSVELKMQRPRNKHSGGRQALFLTSGTRGISFDLRPSR